MITAGSFKIRLVIAAAVLSTMVVMMIFSAQGLINESRKENVDNLLSMSVLNTYLATIKNKLLDTERLIYQQAVNPDAKQSQLFLKRISDLQYTEAVLNKFVVEQISGHAQQSHSVVDLQRIHHLVTSIIELTQQINTNGQNYFSVSEDLVQRVPGMRILTDKLLPQNDRFMAAAELAIAESENVLDQPHQVEIRNLFQNLRYVWSQQISWVRLFIANRAGVFGEAQHSMNVSLKNRQIYVGQANDYIKKLEQLNANGVLDIQESQSTNEIRHILVTYEIDFYKVKTIYFSNDWRHDLQVLHNKMMPLFENVWSEIGLFEAALGDYAKTSITLSQNVTTQSRYFIWIVGAISLMMMLITYMLFDRILRRPLLQIATALDAEAAGKAVEIKLHNPVEETGLLISAFRNMQKQVHHRQTRLESILDNAAEGIITINEIGEIETFNAAAQSLFGYSFAEVAGKNVKMLVPEPHRTRHDDYLAKYIREGTESVIGVMREVSAERKNGTLFAMSLKVSEMYLDGERHFTAVVDDISDRKALIQNLRNLAEHDSLTGLYNRLYFSEELERAVVKKRRGDPNAIALLYIDLDNFKYVNDTMGHLAGDQLLIEVGSILTSKTRESDLLARLGGDEFAVILFRPDPLSIADAAERFRQSIEEYVFLCDGKTVNIGCSIGVAELSADIHGKDQILSRADIACTEAKKRGRNIVHIFTEHDQYKISDMSSDIGWASKIKQSIANDCFVLAGQPVVATNTKKVNFVEVLLRLRNEHGEIIPPAGFMPSAERFGLMADIDRWVIGHALALLAQMHASNKNLRFSINLSANFIEDKNIIEIISKNIRRYGINPSALLFEVTESAAIADLQNASKVLRKLRDFGCSTALDDFGVGYSSFAYLKELPVDYVKIDGAFVRDIDKNHLSLAFVKSINDIAHAMGKKTVAEFVETQRCLDQLNSIGVDYVQGYFLGKPELFAEHFHAEAIRLKYHSDK